MKALDAGRTRYRDALDTRTSTGSSRKPSPTYTPGSK